MIDLKKVRAGLKVNQREMAEILNCTQAYISQIENNRTDLPTEFEEVLIEKYGEAKIASFNTSKILKTLGWRDASDPDYVKLKQQLNSLLDQIQQKTNYSIEEISKLVYRKNDTIPNDVLKSQVHPNMIKYILKHLNKLGLTRKDIILESDRGNENEEKSQLHFRNIKNFVAFILNKEVAKADSDIWLKEVDLDYFVNSNIDISPKIIRNDILGIKNIAIEEIQFGQLYLLIFNNGSHNIQYISQGNRSEILNLSYQIPPKGSIEIQTTSIYKLFSIVIAIRKIEF